MSSQIKALTMESGYFLRDGLMEFYTLNYTLIFNQLVSFDQYQTNLSNLLHTYPKLKCNVENIGGNIYWVEDENIKVEDYVNTILIDSNNLLEFENTIIENLKLYNYFILNPVKDLPFKIFRFISKNIDKEIWIVSFHHSYFDGKSALKLLKYLGSDNKVDTTNVLEFSHWSQWFIHSDRKKIKKLFKNTISQMKKVRKNAVELPKSNLIYNNNLENSHENFNYLIISEQDFNKIIKISKKLKITVNDFISTCLIMLSKELSDFSKSNMISVGFTGHGSYLISQNLGIGNYSIIGGQWLVPVEACSSYYSIVKFIKSNKGNELSIIILFIEIFLSFIPVHKREKFIEKHFRLNEINQNLFFSNVGNIEEEFDLLYPSLENIFFIANKAVRGLPSISISSFKSKLTISIFLIEDQEQKTFKLKSALERNIYKCIEELERFL